jgi:hypothetical protein
MQSGRKAVMTAKVTSKRCDSSGGKLVQPVNGAIMIMIISIIYCLMHREDDEGVFDR